LLQIRLRQRQANPVRNDLVNARVRHHGIRVAQGGNERRLALRQRQRPFRDGVDEQAHVRAHMVHHAVGLEDKVGAAPKPGPKLIERTGKVAFRSRDQQRPRRSGGEIP
jgi:hypothetical protein